MSNFVEMAVSLRAAAAETAAETSTGTFGLTLVDGTFWNVERDGNGYCIRPVSGGLKGTVLLSYADAEKLAEHWNANSPEIEVKVVSVGALRIQAIDHFNVMAAKFERLSGVAA